MYESSISTISTKVGNCYEIPKGIDDKTFYDFIYEFVDLAKEKGLTIRQAQYLFKACSDYVLDSKIYYINKNESNNALVNSHAWYCDGKGKHIHL